MKDPIVTVIRRFIPITTLEGSWETPRSSSSAAVVRWPALEALHRVLILADPGMGKTFEVMGRARRLVEKGKHAFFIRIERIDADFENAFEIGSADAFRAWLLSTDEAWFFLDSVDEAQLETPRALEDAIRIFGERIRDAGARAHIYITSREDAWRGLPDRKLIEQYLPHVDPFDQEDRSDAEKARNSLKIYSLAPFKQDEIKFFASNLGVSDADAFMDAIERGHLLNLAERPFDLKALVGKWQADRVLGSRLEVLQRLVEQELSPLSAPGSAVRISSERARKGIGALAAAVTLTGKVIIRLPDGSAGADRIDPYLVLPDWRPEELGALLRTGVFDDAVYGGVRFRHREIRELLTAEWALQILQQPGCRTRVEELFFRSIYNERVMVPRLRPTLAWLILFDDQIRARAMTLSPEVATEGGDPSQLPLDVRKAILADVTRRIASEEDFGPSMDNAAIARIASAELSTEVERLLAIYGDNDDAVFFLGRFVWQGQIASSAPALLSIAKDPGRGIYARIAAIRAVMTTGDDTQRNDLFTSIAQNAHRFERRLLADLIANVVPSSQNVDLLLKAIEKLEPYERFQVTGLNDALLNFVNRLPMMVDDASDQPLRSFVDGLAALLSHEPFVEQRECHISQAFAWLIPIALHAVDRLVEARAHAALHPSSVAILSKAPILKYWNHDGGDDDKTKLAALVPRWPELNDTLFWESVAERRLMREARGERLIDDWQLTFYEHFWKFGPNDFDRCVRWLTVREEADDRLVALSRCLALYFEAGKPAEWLAKLRAAVAGQGELEATLEAKVNPPKIPPASWEIEHQKMQRKRRREERKGERDRAAWIDMLKQDPERVRRPAGLHPGQLSNDQYHLLVSMPGEGFGARGERGNWHALVPEFGDEVARSFRDAAIAHWRSFMPQLGSEGANTSSIPYTLFFGLVGLEIEAQEEGTFPSHLSAEDAERAFRYLTWEPNGFPTWFEALYRAHREIGLRAISAELTWELENSEPEKPLRHILSDIAYHAPWLHSDVAPTLLEWFATGKPVSDDTFDHVLTILQGANVSTANLNSLANERIGSAAIGDEQRARWFAVWVSNSPEEAIPALQTELERLPPQEATTFAERFVATLVDNHHAGTVNPSRYRTASHLKALYILMHRYIRVSDDIERANMGVYTPTPRDHAQDARNRLFTMLAEIPGAETYRALMEIVREHPDEKYKAWIAERARRHAIADAEEPVWDAGQIHRFSLPTKNDV